MRLTQPRIPPVTDESSLDPEARESLGATSLGPAVNIFRTLIRHPKLFKRWLVFANHVLLGAPVGAASGLPFRVKAHGSELEYAMRGRPDLAEWGAKTLAGAEVVYAGSEHIRDVLEEVCGE